MDPAEMIARYASLQAQVDQMPADELWSQNSEVNLQKVVKVLDMKADFQNEVVALQNDVLFQMWQTLQEMQQTLANASAQRDLPLVNNASPTTPPPANAAPSQTFRRATSQAVLCRVSSVRRAKSSEAVFDNKQDAKRNQSFNNAFNGRMTSLVPNDPGICQSLSEFRMAAESREKEDQPKGRKGSGWLKAGGNKMRVKAKSIKLIPPRMSGVIAKRLSGSGRESARNSSDQIPWKRNTSRNTSIKERMNEVKKQSEEGQERVSNTIRQQINNYLILNRMSTADEVDAAASESMGKKTEAKRRWDDVLLPSHPFFTVWNNLILVSVAYVAVCIPMQAAFDEDLSSDSFAWFTINVVVDLIFIIDVALKFNTALKQQGRWVLERKAIVKKYLKGEFALDFVAAF
eukprot:2520329-Prymnesium_polylepis.1